MNKKERDWMYRLSKVCKATGVKNPADIKGKLVYYGESEKIGTKLYNIFDELSDPFIKDIDTEYSIQDLEKYCAKLRAKQQIE